MKASATIPIAQSIQQLRRQSFCRYIWRYRTSERQSWIRWVRGGASNLSVMEFKCIINIGGELCSFTKALDRWPRWKPWNSYSVAGRSDWQPNLRFSSFLQTRTKIVSSIRLALTPGAVMLSINKGVYSLHWARDPNSWWFDRHCFAYLRRPPWPRLF